MKSTCLLLPEEMHLRGYMYVTSKSVNKLQAYTFQLFCYVYLSTQKDINILTRKSQQIVVVQWYGRETGKPELQRSVASNLADYRRKKERNRGVLERVVGEKRGRKREVGKKKEMAQIETLFY